MKIRWIAIIGLAALTVAAVAGAQGAAQKTPPKKPATTAGRGRGTAAGATTAAHKAALMNPAKLTAQAPPVFDANFATSAGDFVIEVHRDWSPRGADRFYNLVKNGFFDGCRFFRVIPKFMAQFGLNGDPAIQQHWSKANIQDDPVKQSNKRGFVSFATAGPNTRSTQLFINFSDSNTGLDGQGFAPIGQVTTGMDVVDKIYSGYGDPPSDQQGHIEREGNAYLVAKYPKLDYIKKATIAPAAPAAPKKPEGE